MHSPSVFFLFEKLEFIFESILYRNNKRNVFCIWTHEILFLIECKKIHKS